MTIEPKQLSPERLEDSKDYLLRRSLLTDEERERTIELLQHIAFQEQRIKRFEVQQVELHSEAMKLKETLNLAKEFSINPRYKGPIP